MSIPRRWSSALIAAAVAALVAVALGLGGGHASSSRADSGPAAPNPSVTAQPNDTMWN